MTDVSTEVDEVEDLTTADPASFAPWIEPPAPAVFDWTSSNYTLAVLAAKGCLSVVHGFPSVNREAMHDLLLGIVLDPTHLVTPANEGDIATLGLDRADILPIVWGRPAAEATSHAFETTFLTNQAWARLTNRGSLSKVKDFPPNTIMAESGSDLTRQMTKPDGTIVAVPCTLRFATTVPEKAVSYVINPAMQKATAAVERFTTAIKTNQAKFPGDKELMAGPARTFVNTINGLLAPVLAEAGLVLNPAVVIDRKALNGGKKPKATDAE